MAFVTITSAAPTDWIYGEETPFFYLDNTGNLKTSSSKRGTNSSLNGTLLGPFFLIWGLKIPPLMPKVQIHLDKDL